MKIARFSHDGGIAFGVVDDDELVVLGGDPMFAGFEPTGERVALHDVKLLAPVIPRSKVVVMGDAYFAGPEDKAASPPREPAFTLKPNTTVIGPGDAIVLPAQSDDVTVEGALTIVIGTIAKNLTVDNAADAVFGFTIANDVTARDLERRDGHGSRAKAFDSFCPLGPVIDTDFDAAAAVVRGRINTGEFQSADTALSRHTIAEIVSFASSVFTLLPGDLILAGAPGRGGDAVDGVIVDGDTVQIEIPGIGILSNPVRRPA